jgi:hypothetical protein
VQRESERVAVIAMLAHDPTGAEALRALVRASAAIS